MMCRVKASRLFPRCAGQTVSVKGVSQWGFVGERSAGIVAKEGFKEGFEGNHAMAWQCLEKNSPLG